MPYLFVRELTGQALTSSPASVSATVPAAGCALGNLVTVGVVAGDDSTTPTMTDTRSNTWTLVGSAAVNTGTRPSHTWLFYSVLTTALVSGDTIKATYNVAPTGGAIVADEFSSPSTKKTDDQNAQGNGNGTTPASGAKTTRQADELLIGIQTGRGPNGGSTTFTQGTGWTSKTVVSAGAGAPGQMTSLCLEYQIVSVTGSYNADGTWGSTKDWGAVLGTFFGFNTSLTGTSSIQNLGSLKF